MQHSRWTVRKKWKIFWYIPDITSIFFSFKWASRGNVILSRTVLSGYQQLTVFVIIFRVWNIAQHKRINMTERAGEHKHLLWYPVHLIIRGLVKKFYLLPCNFFVVNAGVLKIGMDIHVTFFYTQEKLCIDTFTAFLFVMSKVKNDLVHRKR